MLKNPWFFAVYKRFEALNNYHCSVHLGKTGSLLQLRDATPRVPARRLLRLGDRHRLADVTPGLPLLQDSATPPEALAAARCLPHCRAATGPTLSGVAWHQLGPNPPRRLQKAVK